MRVAYFDCFSGCSGDMILAALLDAGLEVERLRKSLAGLPVDGYTLEAAAIRKQGFAATQLEVRTDPGTAKPHRHLEDIRQIIARSRLPGVVREQAAAVLSRLAEAEARVHGTTIEQVHFHEVGAIDAIVDVVGVCVALHELGIERVCCSPIPTGSGTVQCEHGLLPVPAPATAELLKGVPLASCQEEGELTTPTGAAILTTLADGFGPMPGMSVERIGVGAGRREGRYRPNILRVFIGEAAARPDDEEADEIVVLEVNLDDVSGQVIAYVTDRLFEAGALDVFTTPIYMKKNRPATQLTALVPPALRDRVEAILFAETTTFGIRGYPAGRRKLARTVEMVETEVGPLRVKVGRRGGQVVAVAAEFEDCRAAAQRTGRPLAELMQLAIRTWLARTGPAGAGQPYTNPQEGK